VRLGVVVLKWGNPLLVWSRVQPCAARHLGVVLLAALVVFCVDLVGTLGWPWPVCATAGPPPRL